MFGQLEPGDTFIRLNFPEQLIFMKTVPFTYNDAIVNALSMDFEYKIHVSDDIVVYLVESD